VPYYMIPALWYHRAVEKALAGKFPLVQVNPLQARGLAQNCGTRAKRDMRKSW